jgi:hypothetical protein
MPRIWKKNMTKNKSDIQMNLDLYLIIIAKSFQNKITNFTKN